MPDIDKLLADLSRHPPFPRPPVAEVQRRARSLRRRRRRRYGAGALAGALAAAGAAGGLIASRAGTAASRRVVVTGPSGAATTNLRVAPSAWRNHGRLSFVSGGHLWLLDDRGILRRVAVKGVASKPAWSTNGQWVAFLITPPPPAREPYISEPSRLWVARSDGSGAHPLTGPDLSVARFSWGPAGAGQTVAFVATSTSASTSTSTGASVTYHSELSLAEPTSPTVVRLLTGTGAPSSFAWAPSGKDLAVGTTTERGKAGAGLTGAVEVVPVDGGAPRTVLTSPGNAIDVATWWPRGGGVLYWVDNGGSSSIAADGLPLDSVDLASGRRVTLGTTLVHRHWLAWSPDGNQLAFVAGPNRSVWDSGKHIETCSLPAGTCRSLAQPADRVSLEPVWTASGDLVFVRAPGTTSSTEGPPPGVGLGAGEAPYGTAALTAWEGAQHLWQATDGGTPRRFGLAGAGAHSPTRAGRTLLYVRHGDLWYLAAGAGAPVEVAGPLGTASRYFPSYYGYVGWSADYAWHR